MTDSIASWVTLSALFASAGWYIFQSPERNLNAIVMCIMSGILCLFGGFLISGLLMKLTGSFENPLIPALLVCFGTAICIVAHTLYKKRAAS
ncbi:hypothetical protein ACMXYV_03890 [Neptuniibacter sp. SY11_33]|uniref:hypothetical protein n=1 Tax=unclassified Neptuniibacter TaxID=2630693 RepID=UPI0039F74287